MSYSERQHSLPFLVPGGAKPTPLVRLQPAYLGPRHVLIEGVLPGPSVYAMANARGASAVLFAGFHREMDGVVALWRGKPPAEQNTPCRSVSVSQMWHFGFGVLGKSFARSQ